METRYLIVAALVACATPQHPNPAWWNRYNGHSMDDAGGIGVRSEGNGLQTLEILDAFDKGGVDDPDPTNHAAVARIEHATGRDLRETTWDDKGSHKTQITAFETKDPATGSVSWFIVSWWVENDGHTHIRSFSPPLKEVVSIKLSGESLLAVKLAGELYLPLADTGAPAWFPDGVVGVKPLMVPDPHVESDLRWRAWLVRWDGKVPGWSLSRWVYFNDQKATTSGPVWKDVTPATFESDYGTLHGLLGTRFDGTCEAVAFHKDWLTVQPEETTGATCDAARANLLERYYALVKQNNDRLAQLDLQAKLDKAAAERAIAEETKYQLAQIAAQTAYEHALQPVNGKRVEWTAELCTLAGQMDPGLHSQVVARRVLYKLAVPGEQACVEARAANVFKSELQALEKQRRDAILEQEKREQLERERAARAQQSAAPGASYAIPSTSLYSGGDPHAAEQRIDAMNAWNYGTHRGVCPFSDLSLCN